MNLLQRVGAGMREDSMVTSDFSPGFGSALTPAQAKAQIQTLMNDRDFTGKYLKGDETARTRMAELHKYAFPEGT